jgi:hypothetical protein
MFRVCRRLTEYVRRIHADSYRAENETEIEAVRKKWVEPFERIRVAVQEEPLLWLDLVVERVLTVRFLAREAEKQARIERQLWAILRGVA